MRALWLLLLVLQLTACRVPGLSGAEGDLTFDRPTLDLGEAFLGPELTAPARLQNRGRSPLAIEWTVPDGFEVEGLIADLPPGDALLVVRFQATREGEVEGVLVARHSRSEARLLLTARGLPLPDCPAPTACSSYAFDLWRKECVATVAEDGRGCDPGSKCILEATCQEGRCVGTPRVCDDQNACTLNTCNALSGCEFPPSPPCPGDGSCQVGVCHPLTGCGLEPAWDGTICGEVTCGAAEVCIAGDCVVRDPPDGFICAEPSPCQAAGICQGTSCERLPPVPLNHDWSFQSALGTFPTGHHDFVLEPDGQPSLMGFPSARPILRASGASAVQLEATARRCILWNKQLACADHAEVGEGGQMGPNGRTVLLDLATGKPTWVFSLGAHRPDFAQESNPLFLARLASMGTDRLAALYESYPRPAGNATLCRNYYLAVLDGAGGLISSRKLVDPFLSECNHPHPYGVASDSQGNLYIAFSPSSAGGAPLAAQSPTLLMSFDRDGAFRWKRLLQYPGGELGVANGQLFSEGSPTPLDAASGIPLAAFGGPRELLGRAVVTPTRYVSSPLLGMSSKAETRQLHGYDRTTARAWTFQLGVEEAFLSRELRLASWRPRTQVSSQDVVLALARRAGRLNLLAVDPKWGKELWSCALYAPDAVEQAPQLFEVADGRMVLMGDAHTCGDCDPPFAYSNASFWRYDLAGISPSHAPWPGTFGGPGHDHLEKGGGFFTAPNQGR